MPLPFLTQYWVLASTEEEKLMGCEEILKAGTTIRDRLPIFAPENS